jgi:hypothetical protein
MAAINFSDEAIYITCIDPSRTSHRTVCVHSKDHSRGILKELRVVCSINAVHEKNTEFLESNLAVRIANTRLLRFKFPTRAP